MMEKIGWIGGACLLTTAAFFIGAQSHYMWTSIIASLVIVTLFWLFLLRKLFSASDSPKLKWLASGSFLILGAITVYSGISQYNRARWQHDLLMDIRQTIERGISKAHTNEPLLYTLNAYYNDMDSGDETLQQLFDQKFGSDIREINGEKRYLPSENAGDEDASPVIFAKETAAEDSLILIAQSLLVQGRDTSFVNYNSLHGKMEYHAILTQEGLQYERKN